MENYHPPQPKVKSLKTKLQTAGISCRSKSMARPEQGTMCRKEDNRQKAVNLVVETVHEWSCAEKKGRCSSVGISRYTPTNSRSIKFSYNEIAENVVYYHRIGRFMKLCWSKMHWENRGYGMLCPYRSPYGYYCRGLTYQTRFKETAALSFRICELFQRLYNLFLQQFSFFHYNGRPIGSPLQKKYADLSLHFISCIPSPQFSFLASHSFILNPNGQTQGLGLLGYIKAKALIYDCLLYTSPSPRDLSTSRMPSSA